MMYGTDKSNAYKPAVFSVLYLHDCLQSQCVCLFLQEAEEKNPRLLLFPEEMKFLKDASQ